jgi:hypothetical protein
LGGFMLLCDCIPSVGAQPILSTFFEFSFYQF